MRRVLLPALALLVPSVDCWLGQQECHCLRPGPPGLSPLAPLEPGATPRAVLARRVHALSWRVGPWEGSRKSLLGRETPAPCLVSRVWRSDEETKVNCNAVNPLVPTCMGVSPADPCGGFTSG